MIKIAHHRNLLSNVSLIVGITDRDDNYRDVSGHSMGGKIWYAPVSKEGRDYLATTQRKQDYSKHVLSEFIYF